MNAWKAIEALEEIYDYLDDSPDYRKNIKEIIEWIKGVDS